MNRQPILGGMDEFLRLHDIAKTAALQTGAKGIELDETIAGVLHSLIAQSNRAIVAEQSRPKLVAVQ